MNTLRDADRVALVKLLADEDATVHRLLKEKFLEMGSDARKFLETVAVGPQSAARRGALEILRAVQQHDAYQTFARFCAASNTRFDLETGCWLLAKTRYPDLDDGPYRARLDEMARELRARLTGREAPRATIEVCNRYFFRRLGFRGNVQDYHDPDNSYLNRVLDRRLGIPITLSSVYLLVGWRIGLPLQGIGLPGHFVVKWQSRAAQFYIDAFNDGRALDEADCREMCERYGQAFHRAFLEPATPRQMLLRMCRNLRAVYTENDFDRAEQFSRFTSLLSRD